MCVGTIGIISYVETGIGALFLRERSFSAVRKYRWVMVVVVVQWLVHDWGRVRLELWWVEY